MASLAGARQESATRRAINLMHRHDFFLLGRQMKSPAGQPGRDGLALNGVLDEETRFISGAGVGVNSGAKQDCMMGVHVIFAQLAQDSHLTTLPSVTRETHQTGFSIRTAGRLQAW